MQNCRLRFIERHHWLLWSAWKSWRSTLMTLMKLKLNLFLADLPCQFAVSDSLLSKTAKFWISIPVKHLTSLIVWVPRNCIGLVLQAVLIMLPGNLNNLLPDANLHIWQSRRVFDVPAVLESCLLYSPIILTSDILQISPPPAKQSRIVAFFTPD